MPISIRVLSVATASLVMANILAWTWRAEAQVGVQQSAEWMLSALRMAGYSRFAEAIAIAIGDSASASASNISASWSRGLTFFAPTDDALLLPLNTQLLHYHVASRNGALSFLRLEGFPNGTRLHTLLSNRTVLIAKSQGSGAVTVDDAAITVPNVYFDGLAAVHGIDRLLDPRPASPSDAKPDLDLTRNASSAPVPGVSHQDSASAPPPSVPVIDLNHSEHRHRREHHQHRRPRAQIQKPRHDSATKFASDSVESNPDEDRKTTHPHHVEEAATRMTGIAWPKSAGKTYNSGDIIKEE